MVTKTQLDALFYPKSIAVIGASRDSNSVGTTILRNCINAGYKGNIYPINPKADTIVNLPCYKSVLKINHFIDCAVIVVPSPIVPAILEECGQKRIPSVIIISSGFKEYGGEGLKREKEICTIAEKYNIAILGPNCLGIINTKNNLNLSFAKTYPSKGHVGFVTQSGAIGAALLDMGYTSHLGISLFASVGNEAGITTENILGYLCTNQETSIVGCYVEQIQNPPQFLTLGKKYIQKEKPLIIIKAGKTNEGSKAVQSHTGAMAGSNEAYTALFTQSGAIDTKTTEDFINCLTLFSTIMTPTGRALGIITNAGGPAILATDYAISHSLTVEKMKNTQNPYDLLGDATPEMYQRAYDLFDKNPAISMIHIIITPQTMTDVIGITKRIINIKNLSIKPLCVTLMGEKSTYDAYMALRAAHIPVFQYPESAIQAFSYLTMYRDMKIRMKKHIETPVSKTESISISSLPKKAWYNEETLTLLRKSGIPVQPYIYAKTKEEFIHKTSTLNYPVAIKLLSDSVVHKKQAGMIRLNVYPKDIPNSTDALLSHILKNQPNISIDGYMAMKMANIHDGIECIIGIKSELPFGKLIIVGAGGSNVEIYKDFSTRIAPLTKADVEDMIQSLKLFTVLSAYDTEALISAVLAVSNIASNYPEISEMDINPLLLYKKGKGCVALDARFKRNEKE